jgi:outer membrane protein TolC
MRQRPVNSQATLSTIILIVMCVIMLMGGCRSRNEYRRWADREVASVITDKQCDDRWSMPARPVTADPRSRMADPTCPDCGPLPPDDPAAHCFMEFPDRMRGWSHWHARGDLPSIEFPDWQQYLPLDESGVLKLNRESAIELARLHSRDYQDRVEQLYFTALGFTLERFEFATKWFHIGDTAFDRVGTGGPPSESRLLTTSRNIGFTRNFAAGGDLLVDFANSFVWEFAGDTVSTASSGLLVAFVQPLLRRAFRQVRLELLTQAERDLLYDVRDFGRFRRIFYVNLVGTGYLPLLAIAQSIKNQEKNLASLERNLEEHEQLSRAGLVAPIQVDQVFQDYQQGRLNLLNAQQSLQTSLDEYKFLLGLPPEMEIELDEEALRPFELNDPKIEELQAINEKLRLELIQADEAPGIEQVKQGYVRLKNGQKRIVELLAEVASEFDEWSQRLDEADKRRDSATEDELERLGRERELAARIKRALAELEEDIDEDARRIAAGENGEWLPLKKGEEDEPDDAMIGANLDEPLAEERNEADAAAIQNRGDDGNNSEDAAEDDDSEFGPENNDGFDLRKLFQSRRSTGDNSDGDDDDAEETVEAKLWKSLKTLVGRRFRGQLSDLFVIQTQIRVYLITAIPTKVDPDIAIQQAVENRLDLMNARGNVVDAYRAVEVAADALQADLDLRFRANLGTDPARSNPIRFDASANRYTVGVRFDNALNRFAERNVYRAAQIRYQQARRAYMALRDGIVADVRRDIRQLEFSKFGFEISRLQLLTAARQVDLAQVNLRSSTEPNSSLTRNLLEALQRLLGAKNGLIQSWVSYQASRMALYRDLDIMQIAADGTWINEDPSRTNTDPDVFFDRAQDGFEPPEQLDSAEFERRYIEGEFAIDIDDRAINDGSGGFPAGSFAAGSAPAGSEPANDGEYAVQPFTDDERFGNSTWVSRLPRPTR